MDIWCLVGIIRCVGKAGSTVIPLSLIKMSGWFWSVTVINIWWIKASGIGAQDRQIVMQWDTKMPLRYLIHRSPLLSQQRSELCLPLDWGKKRLTQVLLAWHNATKVMQPCIDHAGGVARWASDVWDVDLQVVLLSLSRRTEPPGQQMFHRPGGRMSRELLAASGYRAPLFWKGFVLKNRTPEITRPAAASIWKDQPSGRDGGLAFKRRASSSGSFGFEVHE